MEKDSIAETNLKEMQLETHTKATLAFCEYF
jgi:hypothetical protein